MPKKGEFVRFKNLGNKIKSRFMIYVEWSMKVF